MPSGTTLKMRSMMRYSFGAIVLVPFPFTDQTAIKKRPAVVISSPQYNDLRPDLVIMAVTSQMRIAGEFDGLAITDWQDAGLLKPSAVKPVFATIAQPLVVRALGGLTNWDRQNLIEWMKRLLG